jgi:hypothetical protein
VTRLLERVPWLAGGFQPAQMAWDDTLMESILIKARFYAMPIHGGKYQTKVQWFWRECTPQEKTFLDQLTDACFEHALSQFPRMLAWARRDFLFLDGPPGSESQQWHFDTREDMVGMTITVGGSKTPTEFAPLVYASIDVDDEHLHTIAAKMQLPKIWAGQPAFVPPKEWNSTKTLFPFMANALHRGPAVPLRAPTRAGIYMTWGPDGTNTERFIDNTFFNSLVDQYVYTHTLTHTHTHLYSLQLFYLLSHPVYLCCNVVFIIPQF